MCWLSVRPTWFGTNKRGSWAPEVKFAVAVAVRANGRGALEPRMLPDAPFGEGLLELRAEKEEEDAEEHDDEEEEGEEEDEEEEDVELWNSVGGFGLA